MNYLVDHRKISGFYQCGIAYNIRKCKGLLECLILISQASARPNTTENTVSALTSQKAFLNNVEDYVNRRVNIREDIKTLSVTHRVRSITAWVGNCWVSRWAEEGLKSCQVNYVNISITGIALRIQNAKVYQIISLINCGVGKCRHIIKKLSVLFHLMMSKDKTKYGSKSYFSKFPIFGNTV